MSTTNVGKEERNLSKGPAAVTLGFDEKGKTSTVVEFSTFMPGDLDLILGPVESNRVINDGEKTIRIHREDGRTVVGKKSAAAIKAQKEMIARKKADKDSPKDKKAVKESLEREDGDRD